MNLHRRSFATAVSLALLTLAPLGAVRASDDSLRATMQDVLQRLVDVLPHAFGPSPLSAEDRAAFDQGLDALTVAAAEVAGHGGQRDAGFRYLGRTLQEDLRAARRSLDRGEEDSARYFLVGATANCVSCHSRLPAQSAKLLPPLNGATVQPGSPSEITCFVCC